MEPKFQSSFIPRGPVSAGAVPTGAQAVRRGQRDIISFLASILFIISLVMAGGSFLYKLFLQYNLSQMKGELESARAALEPETVNTLIRLNSRLVSTETLLKNHKVISPILSFLEVSTPKTVRYTDFNFSLTTKGPELVLQGQARSYAALASAADVFNQAGTPFTNAVFSDLRLDDKGNVVFTLRTQIKPNTLLYSASAKPAPAITPAASAASASTTTATSSPTRR